jgi:predicted glycoside hydrolase/deacetylase ChbG (UPF0249 family)
MSRQLILCADDFAMSPEISTAIARLAAEDRVNAVSCMAIMPGWAEDARRLRDLPRRAAVGLHVVLTDLNAVIGGRLPKLDRLARQAVTGKFSESAVRAEVEAQFERFSDAIGRAPDFVDGHQHCHHLPRIRRIVLEVTASQAPGAWLRDCSDNVGAMLARPYALKALRSAMWSAGFGKASEAAGLRVNQGFAGHYDFRQPYAGLFERFLVRPGRRHLVMCHPGGGYLPGDSISAARRAEYYALSRLPVRELAEAAGLEFDSRFTTARG